MDLVAGAGGRDEGGGHVGGYRWGSGAVGDLDLALRLELRLAGGAVLGHAAEAAEAEVRQRLGLLGLEQRRPRVDHAL